MRKRSPIVREQSTQDDRQFVEALSRGLSILRAYQREDSFLGNQELSRRTGIPKATVSRITYTLAKLGYLDYSEEFGRYRLGASVLALGYSCLTGMRIRDIAQPYMQEMSERAGPGVLVALGARDDIGMIYLACARSSGMISLLLNVGSRVSLERTAMGRAYIAGLPDAERAVLLEQLRQRIPETEWPAIETGILRAVDEVARYGFFINMGEWQPDVHAIGVPFHSPHLGDPLLAFNCGGPSYLLPRDRLVNDLGPRLVEMARTVRFSASTASSFDVPQASLRDEVPIRNSALL